MKALKLTSVAFALASLSLVASCADEEESIIIAGAPMWDQTCGVTVPASDYLQGGRLDVRFETEYRVPLEIQNQLQAQSAQESNSGTDTSELQIVGVDVRISSPHNPDLIEELREEDPALVDFTPSIPTNSLGGGDTLGMSVTGIPGSTASRLAAERVERALAAGDEAVAALGGGATELEIAQARAAAENGVLNSTETYDVHISLRARRTGNNVGGVGEIEAREFKFPVEVCYGCLLSCVGCQEASQCPASTTGRLFKNDFVGLNFECGTAQDDTLIPVACEM